MTKGDYDIALSLYAEAWGVLEHGPHAGATAFNVGQCLRKLGHPVEAGEWFERALATGQVETYRKEIMGHITAGRKAKGARDAEAELEAMGAVKHKGVTDERGQAKSTFKAATDAYHAKDYALAATLYTDALLDTKSAADRGPMMFNLAQCYRMSGDPAKAAAWYTTCLVEGGPTVTKFRKEIETRLAECQAAGMTDAADRTAFESANEQFTNHDYRAAVDAYMTIYRSPALPSDKRAGVAFNIAQALRLSGDPKGAATWYPRALGTGGGAYDAEIKAHLAACSSAAAKESEGLDALVSGVKAPGKKGGKAKAPGKDHPAAAPATAGV